MTCEQAELRMAELLAGEIAAGDRAELEKHLLDCAACRGDFELAREGARIEWADVSVPKEVIEATLASFREPAPAVRFLRWATAAAAVFGLAALLIASSRNPKADPAPMPVASARPEMLATMQDPAVGAMMCKDEEGRPVGELGLKSHDVSVEILDGIAKTTVEENFENHTGRRLEGTFHFPLPSDASISRLALEVNGKIEEGTCLERERAREVFEGIVRRMQDPALLEWQPGGFFKCRVFPIEPHSTKRVIVAYTQALPCFQGKMTYVYPLASDKTRTHAPEEVRIGVQARFSGALAKIESPSHHLEVQRRNANEATMSFRAAHYRPNNDFVVTMEPGPEEVRVVSHKTDGEDGYFACFATPQGGGERKPASYAFVLDASASISAPRLDVAKRLVRAMMERRIDGDRFEVLSHHLEVERSGPVDLRAANDFMDRIRPIGGSDVLKALQAAGDAEIVYIGKGAPTFGETEPSKILEAMKGRRIRTIAVGSDANVQLLERLGGMMRVNPNDDVAKRVTEIAATIGAPVLSEVKLDGGDAVYDVVGVRDLFYGERLIVSGRYRGPTAKLAISGRGYRREVDVAFPAKEEGNNYVRRLWAQRKVADRLAAGPSTKDEVTALGVKYQIMTPYTSFLVLETEQMWKDHQLKREVQKQDEVLGKGGEEEKKPPTEMERIAQELARGRSVQEQQQIYESQRHYELALAFHDRGEFDKAKIESQKAIAAWHENLAARKLLNDVNRVVIGGKAELGARSTAETARDDFRVRIEQAQVEITKHVRDGERYRNARMYDQAIKEFENAEFKILNIPYEVQAMNELLPLVKDSTVKARNARILEERGTEEEKRRMAEAEAAAPPRVADEQYRLAERLFQAGDFDQSEAAAQKALQADPNHAPSRALSTENLFILGKGRATPSTNEYDKFMREGLVRHQQLLTEVDAARERARLASRDGNLALAEREYRKIIEFSKWMPTGVELETRRREAEELLSRTRPREIPPVVEPGPVVVNPTPPPPPVVKPPPPQVKPERKPEPPKPAPVVRDPVPVTRAKGLTALEETEERSGEDSRARAIREAYEEQLRRDRQDVTIKTRNAADDAIIDEFRRQSGWNFTLEGQRGPGFTAGESARIQSRFTLDHHGYVALPTEGGVWKDIPEIFSITTNVVSPGATITDALPLQLATGNGQAVGTPMFWRDPNVATKVDADLQLFVRQSEVQLAQIQELTMKVDEHRSKLSKSIAEGRQQDVGRLEEQLVEMTREKKHLEEKMNAIAQAGGNVNVAPKKALEAKVTAFERGLVVFSIGKDDGVLEGDEFTIYRGGDFVAKLVVDRSERKWAAGPLVLKAKDPRVADDVSNHIFVSAPRGVEAFSCTIPTISLDVVSASEDGSRVSLTAKTVVAAPQQFFAVTRAGRFVAMIRIEHVANSQVHARVFQNLSVGRILPGDRAVYVGDPKAYLAALPAEVRLDLASRASQQAIRAKMELKE